MAYWRDRWTFRESREYEYKFAGKYGAKGEKRGPRKKATPEQVEKQNQLNREKKIRRLIKDNFEPGDIWATLKYQKGTRKPAGEVKKDLRKFLTLMRREYKKRGDEFKFIYRIEVGKEGGIHIHILVNRLDTKPDTDMTMQDIWKHGRVNYETIYEAGGYKDLSEYIVKKPDEEVAEQLQMFEEGERREFVRYSTSRNLTRQQPERTSYSRRTVRKIVEEGLKAENGYYIDKDSVECGVNQFTGMSYIRYTEIRLDAEDGERRGS